MIKIIDDDPSTAAISAATTLKKITITVNSPNTPQGISPIALPLARINSSFNGIAYTMVGNRWNFIVSVIPLYHSTLLGQYNANSTIYNPPIRNWAFDSTFLDPNKLPPSTPQFQYVQPTALRQIL